MNLRIGIILIGLLFMSCDNNDSSSQIDEESTNCSTGTSTATILVNIDEEIYNDDESVLAFSKYSWSSDGTNRILNGNGIPNHEVGTFPNSNNPNSISEQTVSKKFTLCPSIIYESGLELIGPAMAIAYALNSVKFDPATNPCL